MDMSFVGISGEITVFELMSVDILVQDEMYNKDNDLRHVSFFFQNLSIKLD
jgi:hypothetical protein